MDFIAEGIRQKLIRLEDDRKYIVYVHQDKRRSYTNPEEKVQAETFLQLVLVYKYPPDRIQQFVPVQMGSEAKEADIIVYSDVLHKAPLIVVECKKETVSELEFIRASDQATSYAVAEGARYVWTTSKIKNEYFEIPVKKPKDRIPIPDIPWVLQISSGAHGPLAWGPVAARVATTEHGRVRDANVKGGLEGAYCILQQGCGGGATAAGTGTGTRASDNIHGWFHHYYRGAAA